jgi:hypothetical protein
MSYEHSEYKILIGKMLRGDPRGRLVYNIERDRKETWFEDVDRVHLAHDGD